MLKILILKRQLDAKRSELKALEEKDAEFQTREADLETAIGEVEHLTLIKVPYLRADGGARQRRAGSRRHR